MPTFNFQQPSPQMPPDGHHIWQPMPQAPMQGPLGPNLQIDTSAGYGMDFRQMPVSATATSPSEFASPAFFPAQPTPGPHPNQMAMPAADFNGPQFNVPYLSPSPMGDGMHVPQPSVSPVPHMHHQDPMIASHSPPLHGLPRSASADMFSLGHGHHGMHDESLMLSEMYSKQNLNMPMPSPGFDEHSLLAMPDMSEYDTPREHLDMPMTPFGTIDPNALQSGLHHH